MFSDWNWYDNKNIMRNDSLIDKILYVSVKVTSREVFDAEKVSFPINQSLHAKTKFWSKQTNVNEIVHC